MQLLRYVVMAGAILSTLANASFAGLIPNDFYYSNFQWYLPRMGLPDAWMTTTGSTNLKIAVLDTGVISTTPDLTGRVLPALSSAVIFPSGPSQPVYLPPFTDSQLATPVANTLRHGTYVASVAAMQINNGIGGAGVGNFTIQPIRITNDDGFTNPASVVRGIRLAAEQGCKVINISYGVGDYGEVADAATYARSLGSLVIMGAGNSNTLSFINDYESIIFVAGTNTSDTRWVSNPSFGSSWGRMVDLAAPSQNIVAADPSLLPSGYGLVNGTSFSTALTSGVAGLIWSVNPNLTPAQVEQILKSSAVDLGTPGRDDFYGHGRVNASGAIALALATIPEPSIWATGIGITILGIWLGKRKSKLSQRVKQVA
jgi:subtilisin family serine protease